MMPGSTRAQRSPTMHFLDPVHVFAEIENDGGIDGLAWNSSAAAATDYRNPKAPTHLQAENDVLGGNRQNHADRNHSIIPRIGCIHGSIATAETYFSPNSSAQLPFES